jgi:multidrug efflux pump subunit AcrB
MNIAQFSINNFRFTILLFAVLAALGVNSFLNMPRSENPEITIPGTSITVVYPGASPLDLEMLVAKPIEEVISEIDDIKSIKTDLIDGLALIRIEFIFGNDPDEKYDEVVRKVNQIQYQLPEEIYKLEFTQWKSSDVSMLQLALVSDSLSYKQFDERANELKDKLKLLSGVSKVDILACPEQELQISVDMEKMAYYNITLEQVEQAIQSNNANIPGGDLKLSNKVYGIKTSGFYSDIKDIKNTIVSSHKGQLIYLHTIADVSFGYPDNNYLARYNGKNAIFVSIVQKEQKNVFKVFKSIQKELNPFEEKYADMEIAYVFNQVNEVKSNINTLQGNLFQGVLLVGFIILIALGFRSSLVVMISIPLSILISIITIHAFGFGLQQMSIAGLVISLGLLVDNSIVIIENIQRYLQMGLKPVEAAVKGVKELSGPVISATITTMLAFVPIVMIPDKAGSFMKSMPVTVIVTLLASLVIAMLLSPLMASKLFAKQKGKLKFTRVEAIFHRLIEKAYLPFLQLVLRRKWLVLTASIAVLAFSMMVFQSVEKSFFPKAEKPQFLVQVFMNEGSNIDYTLEITDQIEQMLDSIPLVGNYASNIGHGNPRIYYNLPTKSYNQAFAEIFVELKQYKPNEFNELVAALRSEFNQFAKADINIIELEQGPHSDAEIMVYVTGDEIDKLRIIAKEVERIVKSEPGVVNVDNPIAKNVVDLQFDVNKHKAALLGIPVVQVDNTIRTAIAGKKISSFHDADGEEYDIVMRLPDTHSEGMKQFSDIYLRTPSQKPVQLKQLTNFSFKTVPQKLSRFNQQRTALITAGVQQNHNLNQIMRSITTQLESYDFPKDYSYALSGEMETRSDSFGGMQIALIIALCSIFMVLVLQFKSFVQPIIIYTAIPFAAIGMIWTLLVTKSPFSFSAFLGFISLVGIVINDTIILINYANVQIGEGKNLVTALSEACKTRFMPIVLTSVTTIAGLLPLTLKGGTMWAPMGWTMMGGLLFSTILTLIVVPVFYSLFAPKAIKQRV